MTSVTPANAGGEPNLGFTTGGDISPTESQKNLRSGRKVFGANAYLERQKKLGQARNSSPPPNNPPLQKSEFDNEFNAMHSNMADSLKK